MTVYRATKTLTLDETGGDDGDTYVDEANPTVNYGVNGTMSVGAGDAANRRIAYVAVKVPAAPADCDTTLDYEGIIVLRLRMYALGLAGCYVDCWSKRDTFAEDTITWNNRGYDLYYMSITDCTAAGYKSFDFSNMKRTGTKWGSAVWLNFRRTSTADANLMSIYSRESTVGNTRPYVEVTYYQKPPAQITDLKVTPDPNDATRPILTWTSSKDENFGHYEMWRKVGGGAYAQVGGDIAVQGTNGFTDDTGGLTENNVVYYKLREENADGSYNESNEAWLIRPDVSTFTLDDTTPDVNQKVLATITPVAIAATPTPVQNTDFYFAWGSGADADRSYAWSKSSSRSHVWAHAGSHTPKAQVKNSLGYASDLTGLTAGGPAITVANINPIAKVKAAPMLADVAELVTFYGDESYAPAANKNLAAAAAYEWDWDYTGVWGTDATSTYSRITHSWGAAGAKTVALRVKDVDGNYSAVVTIVVTVAAVVTVDLDALADGLELLDTGLERQTFIYEGIDTYALGQAAKRPMTAKVGGFSFTDSDSDGIPDDLATLLDIWNNGKRVQLTVLGTVRTGRLQGAPVHTEGGWDDRYSWTATVVLDP